MRPPVAETSYILVSVQFENGNPFGYVNGSDFVLIAPSEGNAYLCNDSGQITNVNQPIQFAEEVEIIDKVTTVYPAVSSLAYEIATFSVGDNVTIGGTI